MNERIHDAEAERCVMGDRIFPRQPPLPLPLLSPSTYPFALLRMQALTLPPTTLKLSSAMPQRPTNVERSITGLPNLTSIGLGVGARG